MAVTGSFKLVHIHTNGLQIHFQIFCQMFFIMVTPVQLSSNVWYCGMTVHPKASTSSVVFLHLGTYQTYDGKSGLLVTWNRTLLPLPITVCNKHSAVSKFVFVHKMSYAVYVGSWQLPQCHSNSPSHDHHRFLSRWWFSLLGRATRGKPRERPWPTLRVAALRLRLSRLVTIVQNFFKNCVIHFCNFRQIVVCYLCNQGTTMFQIRRITYEHTRTPEGPQNTIRSQMVQTTLTHLCMELTNDRRRRVRTWSLPRNGWRP